MQILIFDTETTGVPQADLPLSKQPHICQFAGVIFETTGFWREIKRVDWLFKPPVPIPFSCTEVHGINDALVCNEPSFAERAKDLLELFSQVQVVGAHNLKFDFKMLELEFERMGRKFSFMPEQNFDTMIVGRELCKLPGRKDGNYKSPKLAELYRFLFGNNFKDAHDALADVLATAKCAEEMYKRGLIKLVEPLQDSLF